VGVVGLLSEWEVHYIKVLICGIELADTSYGKEKVTYLSINTASNREMTRDRTREF